MRYRSFNAAEEWHPQNQTEGKAAEACGEVESSSAFVVIEIIIEEEAIRFHDALASKVGREATRALKRRVESREKSNVTNAEEEAKSTTSNNSSRATTERVDGAVHTSAVLLSARDVASRLQETHLHGKSIFKYESQQS